MTTHLTKIWWDLNKHKLVEQAIPEAEIYKREWVGLTEQDFSAINQSSLTKLQAATCAESILKEKNGQ